MSSRAAFVLNIVDTSYIGILHHVHTLIHIYISFTPRVTIGFELWLLEYMFILALGTIPLYDSLVILAEVFRVPCVGY